MQRGNILLLSLGMSLGLFSIIRVATNISVSPYLLIGVSIFTAFIAITDINSDEKHPVFLFLSIPFSLFSAWIFYVFNTPASNLQNYSEAITIFSLGAVLVSLSFKDEE